MLGVGFVGHVHERERVFVGGEADFAAVIVVVGAMIEDTLCLVGIAVFAVATGKFRHGRLADVYHVQAAAAGASSDGVGVACFLVDGDGMGVAEFVIVPGFLEGDGRVVDVP